MAKNMAKNSLIVEVTSKTKAFWNRVYDVIIYVHDITSKILSYDSNLFYRCGHVTRVC